MNSTNPWSLPRRYWAWLVFAGALGLYLLTLSRGAFPGLSAMLIAGHLGWNPFPMLANPLWGLVARALAALPAANTALVLNIFSALCAAAVVALFFLFMAGWPYFQLPERYRRAAVKSMGQWLAAVVATVALATSVPFWYVATRAHAAAFDLLLLFLALHLLLRFAAEPRVGRLYLLALLWGLGTAEYATFIVFTPVVVVVSIYLLWQARLFLFRHLLAGFGLYGLGLTMYLVGAWMFAQYPAYEWRGFTGLPQVVWYIWRDQYQAIAKSMGALGWLLVFMSSAFPVIMFLLLPLSGERALHFKAGYQFLFWVLGIMGVLILANLPPAPWAITGMNPFLVMPYVFFAVWFGRLAGLGYIMLRSRGHYDPPWQTRAQAVARPMYLAILGVALLASAWANQRAVTPRYGDIAGRYARQMLADLGAASWFISDGMLDDNLLIVARETRRPLKLINMRFANNKGYLNYVASLFSDERLQRFARFGLEPLFREWLERGPDLTGALGVESSANLLLATGYQALPQGTVFAASRATNTLDSAALFEQYRQLWARPDLNLRLRVREDNLGALAYALVKQQASKLANNLGVLMEDQARPDLAVAAYAEARMIDTNNLSALLNLLALSTRDQRPEAARLEQQLADIADQRKGKLNEWDLSSLYGYVRHPQAYVNRGYVWALSGKPQAALQEIQRARSIVGANPQIQLSLATLYSSLGLRENSRQEFLTLLDTDPDNPAALLGLAALALQDQDRAAADQYLKQARALNLEAPAVLLQEALLDYFLGRPKDALAALRSLATRDADNAQVWLALALLSFEQGDRATAEENAKVLAAMVGRQPALAVPLAQLEIALGQTKAARAHLEEVLRLPSEQVRALEQLLRLDIVEGMRDEADLHVEQLIKLRPDSAFGNYILGTIQFSHGQQALAEESFRNSLVVQPTWEAMNDLAWVLTRRGTRAADQEALRLIKQAMEINPKNPGSWDTYGVILTHLGQYDAAREAIANALSMAPGHPDMTLHMAQLYEKTGNPAESLRMAEDLMQKISLMNPETQDELRALLARLRGNG